MHIYSDVLWEKSWPIVYIRVVQIHAAVTEAKARKIRVRFMSKSVVALGTQFAGKKTIGFAQDPIFREFFNHVQ